MVLSVRNTKGIKKTAQLFQVEIDKMCVWTHTLISLTPLHSNLQAAISHTNHHQVFFQGKMICYYTFK